MSKGAEKYQFLSNSIGNDLFKAIVIDIDEGFISISVLLKDAGNFSGRIVDFVCLKFEQYFKYQQFLNPKLVVNESIPHVGRQLYLQATHDESFYGIHISCLVSYYREHELIIAHVGDLDLMQLVLSNTSGEYELIKTNQAPRLTAYLKFDNFHEITPFVFHITPSDGDEFIVSKTDFIENSNQMKKLFAMVPKIKTPVPDEELLQQIDHPILFFSILKTNVIKHSSDNSVVKQITSLSYFTELPKWHLYALMATVALLSAFILIFKPQSLVQRKEKEALIAVEQLIKKETDEIMHVAAESLTEKKDAQIPLKDTLEVTPSSDVLFSDTIVEYFVEPGETLYRISKNFNLPISEIMSINKLADNKLATGQKLMLPVQAVYHSDGSYTLYELSDHFCISVSQILMCNHLQDTNIENGRVLLIPKSNEE